jgi:hypothetical protein
MREISRGEYSVLPLSRFLVGTPEWCLEFETGEFLQRELTGFDGVVWK